MSDPAALIDFAEKNQLETGAWRRAAISRAYYAAFHALQDAVDPMIADADRGRHGCAKHGAVLRALREWSSIHPNKKSAMQYGAEATKCYHLLRTCLDERERADYEMGKAGEVEAKDAVTIVGKAKRIMAFAKKV